MANFTTSKYCIVIIQDGYHTHDARARKLSHWELRVLFTGTNVQSVLAAALQAVGTPHLVTLISLRNAQSQTEKISWEYASLILITAANEIDE